MAASTAGTFAGDRPPAGARYRDAAAPLEERVEDLIARMTIEEKVAQLGGTWFTRLVEQGRLVDDRLDRYLANGTGHVTRISAESGCTPERTATFANEVQRYLVERTRLGIPAIIHEEAVGGFLARDATQFPQAIGLASTWDPSLVSEMADVIRRQMMAVGARQALSPVLDIARDPRWGRVEETYGEDAHLASRLGVAYVRGLQGDDLATGVAATAKHFLGYGVPEAGLNHAPAQVGPRELREVIAAPFRAAINEAGLASVMNAYNEVDGLPCGGSAEILDRLLRDELGFDGVVVADYWAVTLLMTFHAVAADKASAAARALAAGLDLELPALDCYRHLVDLVASGVVDEALVDRSVRRVLRLKLALGLFERPFVEPGRAAAAFDTPADRTLARRLAQQSLVLLKNEGGLLPLAPGAALAVVGPAADDIRLLLGDYHYPAHVEISFERADESLTGLPTDSPAGGETGYGPGPDYVAMTSILAALRAAADDPDGARVRHAEGCDVAGTSTEGIAAAAALASVADVAVVCVGGKSGLTLSSTSGEMRDASDLGLPGVQQRLVEAVVATGTPTVVVVVGGRVHALPWIAEHVPAVLLAWLPGEEGGPAIADVLFGTTAPSGRLPVSLPRSAGHVPFHYDHHSGAGRSQMHGDYVDADSGALFPFGHGLSYTSFAYRDLRARPSVLPVDGEIDIEVTVANTGEHDGVEVVQVYVRDEIASVARPVRRLAAFGRVPLAAGEEKVVKVTMDAGVMAFPDESMQFVVEPGAVRVLVGSSSTDIRLECAVELTGDVSPRDPRTVRPAVVEVA